MVYPTKKLSRISGKEIEQRVLIVLECLYKNDAFLLENAVHERSISHKLGEYLQEEFSGWHVDCEYNRHGLNPKRIQGIETFDFDRNSDLVLPDMVVHHRNSDDNLLVVEIKTRRSEKPDQCDAAKLVAFTQIDGEYKYKYGLFIGFDGLNEPRLVWYEQGKISDI